MANPLVLLDVRTFIGGADLSGAGCKIEVSEESEAKKVTNWRSGGAEELKAGIVGTDFMGEGWWEAGDSQKPDDVFFQNGNRRQLLPWSIASKSDSDLTTGGTMYLCGRVLRTKISQWGSVGDVANWQASGRSAWPLVKGRCAHPSGTARTATGTGTAIQLGAVASGKKIYGNLHVISASGTTPSMTVKVQSDDNSGFTSPTDVLSFAAKTASGQSEALRADGPLTDTYWRVVWAISGTTPSFLFLASFGIE
jgi:hypothetical protein